MLLVILSILITIIKEVIKLEENKNKSLKFIGNLRKEYRYVKYVILAKKIKFKALKKKFERFILVSNKTDIEKEEWTNIGF